MRSKIGSQLRLRAKLSSVTKKREMPCFAFSLTIRSMSSASRQRDFRPWTLMMVQKEHWNGQPRPASSMRVATSMRSGTLQYLHISEFGKICAQAPDKAREIVTGALNTVAAGQFIVIESTAEGQEGAFYEMAQRARERALSGVALTPLDYKFHFFPWWQDQAYQLNDAAVVIGAEDERYFSGLEESGVKLAVAQKRWWVKKAEILGADMKREYPQPRTRPSSRRSRAPTSPRTCSRPQSRA